MNYKEKLKEIKALVFDCDGVFTDGTLSLHADGYLSRRFNAKDGYALQLAIKKGLHAAIITGGTDEAVEIRFRNLGVTHVFLNARDKTRVFKEFSVKNNIKPEEVLYMGDDLPDLPLLNIVGMPCCPNDAVIEVKNASKYISNIKGGKGCVRDVIEQTLKVQNKWMEKGDVIIPSR
ncbi:MAG: KdsC family phosphatase [Flavobacteriales bacterium]